MIFRAESINHFVRQSGTHQCERTHRVRKVAFELDWDNFDWDRESGILGQSNWWFELDWDGVRARLGQRIWNPGTVKLVVRARLGRCSSSIGTENLESWDSQIGGLGHCFSKPTFFYVFFTTGTRRRACPNPSPQNGFQNYLPQFSSR